jgi:hypothetical protein
LDFLRHHADVGAVTAVVAETIETEAVGETAKQHDVVFQSDVGTPSAVPAATGMVFVMLAAVVVVTMVMVIMVVMIVVVMIMVIVVVVIVLMIVMIRIVVVMVMIVMVVVMVVVVMIVMVVIMMIMVMIVVFVRMAAVMMPVVPALASAKAKAVAEFKSDNVPSGPIPAVVVPAVCIAIVGELITGRRAGSVCARRGTGQALDLEPRPAAVDGDKPP